MVGNFGSVLRFAGDKTMSARRVSMNAVSRKIGVPLRVERSGRAAGEGEIFRYARFIEGASPRERRGRPDIVRQRTLKV